VVALVLEFETPDDGFVFPCDVLGEIVSVTRIAIAPTT
jgi:hypothetical protein